MFRIFRPLSLIAIALLTSLAWGSTLSSYRADITATRHGAIDIRAKGEMYFNLEDNNEWEFAIKVKGGPLKSTEVTKGTQREGEYLPVTYKRDTKLLFIKENIEWLFDWDAQKVSGKVKKKSYSHDINSVVHDPNSFQIPLRLALMNGESQFKFQFMKYSRPDTLRFEIIGEELLNLESGRVHTLILKQLEPLRSDEKKLIWVAKDHDFVPVKFTTYEKNKVRDNVVVRKLWINDQLVRFDR